MKQRQQIIQEALWHWHPILSMLMPAKRRRMVRSLRNVYSPSRKQRPAQ